MSITQLSFEQIVLRLKQKPQASRSRFLAMYSSWYGGIVREPELMLLPIDDHMVHRGDGVFEAIKCVDGRIYALDRHLERLDRSADLISLKLPNSLAEIREICVETVRVAAARDAMLRLYISRGPGDFTPNPYQTLGTQIYLVVTSYQAPRDDKSDEKYLRGVSALVSQHKVKEGFFANVKSCNYLQNVLMKKEALDLSVDFTISVDEDGFLAEGSTENFAIVNCDGEFVVPSFARTLRGVTAVRAMELAKEHLLDTSLLSGVRLAQISLQDALAAREIMMLGTTLDCLPVTTFAHKPVGQSSGVGPVCRALLSLLRADIRSGPLTTSITFG